MKYFICPRLTESPLGATLNMVMCMFKSCGGVLYALVEAGSGADISICMADNTMAPLFPRGSSVTIRRRAGLKDGDIGLFFVDGRILLRQYCEDYAGNVYLFVLNRRRAAEDIMRPRSAGPVCCFGRAVLDEPPPLPDI